MDVRCATGIRHGLDGAEEILARAAGEEAAEALEVRVALGLVAPGAGVEINSGRVALPNLNRGVADGRAARGEQAATEPGDFTDGGREAVVDGDEVVVRVERELVGIERPLGLLGRERELLGEEARHGAERGSKGGLA